MASRARIEEKAPGAQARSSRSTALSRTSALGPLTRDRLLAMQRAVGNRAVIEYVQRKRAKPGDSEADALAQWMQYEPEYERARKNGVRYLAQLAHRRNSPLTSDHVPTDLEVKKEAAIEQVRTRFKHDMDDLGKVGDEWGYYLRSNNPDDEENFYENEIWFPSGRVIASSNHNGENPNPPANSDVLWFHYNLAREAHHRNGEIDFGGESDDEAETKEELVSRVGTDVESTGNQDDVGTTSDSGTESSVDDEPRTPVIGTPLPMITRTEIVNHETQHIAWMVLDKDVAKTTVLPTSDDGHALLGSPNGKSAIWMLHDHPDELGRLNIADVTVEEQTKEKKGRLATKLLMHIRYE